MLIFSGSLAGKFYICGAGYLKLSAAILKGVWVAGYLKTLFGCSGIEFGQFLLHPVAGGIGSIGHGFGFAEVGHGGQGAQEGIDVLRA